MRKWFSRTLLHPLRGSPLPEGAFRDAETSSPTVWKWILREDGGLCGNGFHALSSTRYAGAPSRREPFGTLRFCGGSKPPPPYHGNGFCARTEAPMHKPRLCPYGARGAGRVIKFGFCPPHSVGKNPLLGESAISLWHPICAENFCVR